MILPDSLREAPARKVEMLRVAAAVYRQKGLDASLQDIADQLGVTYNALYKFFKNREDLIYQCLEWSGALLHQSIEDSNAAGGTGLERVVRFLRDFLEVSTVEQTIPGWVVVALSLDAKLRVYQGARATRELLARVIADGVDDGSIAARDPEVSAAWILHTLYWWPDELEPEGRRAADIVDVIVEHIARSLAP